MNIIRRMVTTIVGIAMFVTMALPAGAIFVITPIMPIFLNPIYVDDVNGNDANAGEKLTPVKTITKAIDLAKNGANGSYQIYIAEGDYRSETFPLDLSTKNISLYGGYYSDFASRDVANHQTEIMGDTDNTIEVTNISSTISGLKIYDQSGGVGSVINISTNDNSATYRNISVSEVEIVDCSTLGGGIAVYAEDGDTVRIFNNFIHDMEAFGGGILVDGEPSTSEIHHNFLYNNIGFYNIVADNSVIYNNIVTKASGAGINVRDNSKAYNNTVVNGNVGIYVGSGVTGAEFKNNVIASNSADAVEMNGSASIGFNVYHNNGTISHTQAINDIGCDPMLANVNSLNENDYALGNGSTCIDKGTELSDVTDDYFGEDRPKDGDGDADYRSDPGAIEADGDALVMPEVHSSTASPNTFSPDGDGLNDTTTLSYDLNVTSDVLIEIYDGLDMIKEVFSGVESSGTHTAVWDGRNTGGDVVAEKTYEFKITATNSAGFAAQTGNVTVDLDVSTVNCAGFTDVPLSDPLCPAIEYVKDEGIFSGHPDGTFRPHDIINRAETTKVALLGFNIPILPSDGTNLGFTDIDVSAWYITFVRTAHVAGIVEGYIAEAKFKPAQQVNKVEMLKIFLETSGVDLSGVVSPSNPYPDTPTDAWYSVYVQFSKDNALVDSAANGDFNPAEGMERGDVAELFYRFDQAGL